MYVGEEKRWVKVTGSRPIVDDWDEGECACAVVPDDKRIDYQVLIFDEKRGQRRWKSLLRYHLDCPIHGAHPKED